MNKQVRLFIEEKSIRTSYLITFKKYRSSHGRCSKEKLFLKILQYSQEKYLCWSFLNIAKFLRAAFLKNICERLFLKMWSWNWEKWKVVNKGFISTLKKSIIFQYQYHKQVEMYISLLLVHDCFCFFFLVWIQVQYFFYVVRNKLQTTITNKKHFPETTRQWKFDCGLFTNLPRIIVICDFSPSSFKLKRGILRQNKYPILKTACELNSWRTYFLQNISYLSLRL